MRLLHNATWFIHLFPALKEYNCFMLVSILCAVVQEALFNLFSGQTKLHLLMIFCITEKLMSLARLLAYKICTIFPVSIHQESQESKLLLIQYLCSTS